MKSIEVKATARPALGKKGTRDLRKSDAIPAVLYGDKKNDKGEIITTHLTVTNDAVRKLVYSPEIFFVNLNIDGTVQKAVMKDIQFHPVSDHILHIDFYLINEAKPIVMEVPVALNGLAEGVKAGGKLQLMLRKIKVRALYNQIPDKLDVNVSALGLGKAIKVGELSFDGLEMLSAKESVVCVVKLTRAARGAAAVAAR